MTSEILKEAKRLHDLGFAIHWLHARSKRPVESGWTSGPRKTWAELQASYREGLNIGVRLGRASNIGGKFLAVVDIDLKAQGANYGKEVEQALKDLELTTDRRLPQVLSGRGNGSRHLYVLTDEPVAPTKVLTSPSMVKVSMPSAVRVSKRESEKLSAKEISDGLRIRPAWEISLMGEGQQVVLPPSIHPDSGKAYSWSEGFDSKAAYLNGGLKKLKAPPGAARVDKTTEVGSSSYQGVDFKIVSVDIDKLKIPEKLKAMICDGAGITDRSAMLLPISRGLLNAGLDRDQILSVLTDPLTFIGATGFDHAQTRDRYRAMKWVYKFTFQLVERERESMFSAPIGEVVELTPAEMAADEKAYLEWTKAAQPWWTKLDRTDKGKLRATLKNVVLMLSNLAGHDFCRRDLFSIRDFYGRATPWGGKMGAALTDDDVVSIIFWLSEKYGIEPQAAVVNNALTHIALRNAFDPVTDWIKGLPKWDETPRLDSWLVKNFEAQGGLEYLAQVFRKWLCAMILRAYQPGIKYDWMPIFEGAQGVGKSSFGRILVGDKYFLDWLPDLANKDAAVGLQGIWAVELGELATLRKNEIETVKAFLTRTVDKFRPPYGRRLIESPRRCVFFGTTNQETYLRDETGNRRFKPVVVGRLNFEALLRDRLQLFAEARWLVESGWENERTLDLTGDALAFEREIHAEKMVLSEVDLAVENLRNFWVENEGRKPDEKFDFSKFQIGQLFDPKNGGHHWGDTWRKRPFGAQKFDRAASMTVAKALHQLGAGKWKSHGLVYWKLNLEIPKA